jgi:hypothetical protein
VANLSANGSVHLTFWLNTLAPQITTTQMAIKVPNAMSNSMAISPFVKRRISAF